MNKWVYILRTVLLVVVFAVVGGLAPEWYKWGLLGLVLMLIVFKIEGGSK